MTKEKLAIIGNGGHGKVCAEIAALCGYSDIIFLDDCPENKNNIYGSTDLLPVLVNEYDIFVAIGDNALRETFIEKATELRASLATLIHPGSIVSKEARVGEGSVVMPGAVINPGAVIGKGVIVNTCSSVDHDCMIGDFSHVAVGTHLAGTVHVGKGVFIGAGATIINNLQICGGTLIGAGAVVLKDISVPGKYIGVPARLYSPSGLGK